MPKNFLKESLPKSRNPNDQANVIWNAIVEENLDRWTLISAEHFNIDYKTAFSMSDFEVAEANAALNYILKKRKESMPKTKGKKR